MRNKNILLVTNNYPPYSGGSSSILFEILSRFPKDKLYVIHGCNSTSKNNDFELPFKKEEVILFNSHIWTYRINKYLPEIFAFAIYILINKMIKRYNISIIYAHYPNAPYMVAAYFSAKKHNLPLFIYLDILWEERSSGGELRLSKLFESKIFSYASKSFAITEFSVDYLSTKHNTNTIFIPHTISSKYIPANNASLTPIKHKIHFAGGIYSLMNLDCILRLIDAIQLTGYDIELEICSSYVPESITNYKFVTVKYLSKAELIQSQSNSSILFLPQAFESSKPQMIKYNFPTKTMEYLCSNRPILVHSPKESYLTHIAKKEKFAEVVDLPDVEALSHAIIKLLDDTFYQETLINNALSFVKKRKSEEWSLFLYNEITESN